MEISGATKKSLTRCGCWKSWAAPTFPSCPERRFPLVRTREEAQLWQQRYGKVAYAGAWDDRWWHEASVVPPLPEGQPTTKPADEDAAHFLIRMVRKYPHEVTIYEGGPMTNLALAISLDPQFPELAQELVFMGGSLSPQTDNPEFLNNPRHEFNFWFDPEAAEIVLRAPWKKIVCTPTDISVKTHMTAALVKQIEASGTPLARYIARFAMLTPGRRHHVGRTCRGRVDRSDHHHEERDPLHGRRPRSRRRLRQYPDLGSEDDAEHPKHSRSKFSSTSTRRSSIACSSA